MLCPALGVLQTAQRPQKPICHRVKTISLTWTFVCLPRSESGRVVKITRTGTTKPPASQTGGVPWMGACTAAAAPAGEEEKSWELIPYRNAQQGGQLGRQNGDTSGLEQVATAHHRARRCCMDHTCKCSTTAQRDAAVSWDRGARALQERSLDRG